jgi:hypothetical protein
MSNAKHKQLLVALLCGHILFGCTNDYFGIVVVHLEPQPVDSLRRKLLGIHEFRNVKQIVIKDADPNCTYYKLRSQTSNSEIGIAECFGATKMSDTGWGYWVTFVAGPRSNPEVEAELNRLLSEVESTMRAFVGTAKVSKTVG